MTPAASAALPPPSLVHPSRLISWVMIGLALSLFLYVGSNVAYTASTQDQLASAWDQHHASIDSSAATPVVTFQRPRLAVGQSLAKVSIPTIKWSGIVLEGTDDRVLSGGPGHLLGTAYPGEADNVVISNHNSYSLAFANLKAGDKIVLQTDYGTYSYRVTGFRVISAGDKSVSGSSGRPVLTFTTCYPLWAGALARERYVITADLVS